MPSYGLTPAGFVPKPTSQILADMQNQIWQSPGFGPDLDLSSQTPDGQMLSIVANAAGELWELLQVLFNQMNRADAEGAALDNLGALIGVLREGQSFTQVFCSCTLATANAPYAAGALIANVAGQPAQVFSNVAAVTASMISGGTASVLFQSTVPGATPAVNAGTLTQITSPVTGWTAITNPLGQTQAGASQEPDPLYGPRQGAGLGVQGSCTPSATISAIEQLGAAQSPAVTLTASIVENPTSLPVTTGGVTIGENGYAIFLYDPAGWVAASSANAQALGQLIWNNRPAGNLDFGATPITIQDPTLGTQTVNYTLVQPKGLWVSATVAVLPGQSWTQLTQAIQTALVAAAVAPTPPNGIPPVGQLAPGSPVVGSQLSAVISNVPGVGEVSALTFDFVTNPTNTAPLIVQPNQIATMVGSQIVLTQKTPYP